MPEQTFIEKVKSYATLVVAFIAIIGWISTFVANRVGLRKDVENIQTDVTELKEDVESLNATQIQGGNEDIRMQTFIEQHMKLHEQMD